MRRLARKCNGAGCDTVMVIQVGRGPMKPQGSHPFAVKGFQQVTCIQGCTVHHYSIESGRLVGPGIKPGNITIAVICAGCGGSRRLTKFEEIKV